MNIATRDFPDWLGPMLVKELRQGLKARVFVLSFVALQAILVFTVVMYTLNYAEDPAGFTPTGFTSFFWLLIGMQLLILTPLRAIQALAAERTSKTLELIFMTGLSSWRIAFGKWASLLFQALLFVLAVLPYAILRYFFGGVNLTEELLILGFLIVLCATFTAVTLAISGMPGFVRGVAVAIAVFFSISVMPGLLFGFFLGGRAFSGAGIVFSVSWEPVMGLLFFDAALICLAGLEVAGATIAPLAENHALRQRLLVLAAWLPVPLLLAFKVNEPAIAQLCFFGGLAVLSCWYDFARQPRMLRNQVEPFARRGAAASFIGRLFYPGWPGALLFFIVCMTLCAGTGVVVWKQTVGSPPWIHAAALFFMSGAALLTPPLLIGHRFRARVPLVEQSLVHLAGGIVALFAARFAAIYNSEIGAHPLIGLFPPSGLWAIPSAPEPKLFAWLTIALIAFTIITAVMLGRAIPYWRELRVVERDIRGGREATPRATAPLIP